MHEVVACLVRLVLNEMQLIEDSSVCSDFTASSRSAVSSSSLSQLESSINRQLGEVKSLRHERFHKQRQLSKLRQEFLRQREILRSVESTLRSELCTQSSDFEPLEVRLQVRVLDVENLPSKLKSFRAFSHKGRSNAKLAASVDRMRLQHEELKYELRKVCGDIVRLRRLMRRQSRTQKKTEQMKQSKRRNSAKSGGGHRTSAREGTTSKSAKRRRSDCSLTQKHESRVTGKVKTQPSPRVRDLWQQRDDLHRADSLHTVDSTVEEVLVDQHEDSDVDSACLDVVPPNTARTPNNFHFMENPPLQDRLQMTSLSGGGSSGSNGSNLVGWLQQLQLDASMLFSCAPCCKGPLDVDASSVP